MSRRPEEVLMFGEQEPQVREFKEPKTLEQQKHEEQIALNSFLYAEPAEQLEVDESNLGSLISELLNSPSGQRAKTIINSIVEHIQSSKEPRLRVKQAEKELTSSHIHLNIETLTLLGELDRFREEFEMDPELAEELDLQDVLDNPTKEKLLYLAGKNDRKGNIVLHKILDAAKRQLVTLQNLYVNPSTHEPEPAVFALSEQMLEFAQEARAVCKNDLLYRHILDYENTRRTIATGLPGGSEASTEYAFERLIESSSNRLALGLYSEEGRDSADACIALTDSLVGEYKNGKLFRVYTKPSSNETETIKTACIKQNHTDDEYIYEALQREIDEYTEHTPLNWKLETKLLIHEFHKHLEQEKRTFFFDLSRINGWEKLHPVVLDEILATNEYAAFAQGKLQKAKPVSSEVLQNLLAPAGAEKGAEYEYQYLMSLEYRSFLENSLGIPVETLPPHVQVELLRVNNALTKEKFHQVLKAIRDSKFPTELATVFFCARADERYIDVVLDILEKTKHKSSLQTTLFEGYANHVEAVHGKTNEVLRELEQKGFTSLSYTDVAKALLAESDFALKDLQAKLEAQPDNANQIARNFQNLLGQTSASELYKRGTFEQIARAFESPKADIDPAEWAASQKVIQQEMLEGINKALYLRMLAEKGFLAPKPAIFWEISRGLKESNIRFGVDTEKFLNKVATRTNGGVLLELGPGSGRGKEDRAHSRLSEFQDIAIGNKVFFDLEPIIGSFLDIEKLEADLNSTLNEEDRALLIDTLTKALMVESGGLAKDHIQYDSETLEYLAKDINTLKVEWAKLKTKLKGVTAIPSSEGAIVEGDTVRFPNKIDITHLADALNKIAQSPYHYLNSQTKHQDLYTHINAFPEGVIIGDFSNLKRLKKESLAGVMAIRSDVYIEGANYVEHLATVAEKLQDGGVYVSDAFRELYGKGYRQTEIEAVKKVLQEKFPKDTFEFLIVTGPGFEGKEVEKTIPLAVYLTKNASSKQDAQETLVSERYSVNEI